MPTPSPWDFATTWLHFTAWLAATWGPSTTWLERWQTLAAGILGIIAGSFALVAAWWTASRAEKISRQEACRDTEALRRSLAVEIRRSVRLLCQTHEAFTDAKAAFRRGANLPDARDVAKLTSRVHPIVYPATADRIGRLGQPLAEWVVTFYANVKDIQFAGEITANVATRYVAPQELDGIVSVLEGTCRDALPAPLAASAQIPIPTRPIWSSVDQPGMAPLPTFFSDTWEATYTGTVYVTDFAVPGDGYDIFQNGIEVASNVLGTDCASLAPDGCTIGGSFYADDGEAGWASKYFAHWAGPANAGDLFTIEEIKLPTGFTDGTVAVSESVPEPATWAMMLIGFAGLGFAAYRKARPAVSIA